eukprot:26063_1
MLRKPRSRVQDFFHRKKSGSAERSTASSTIPQNDGCRDRKEHRRKRSNCNVFRSLPEPVKPSDHLAGARPTRTSLSERDTENTERKENANSNINVVVRVRALNSLEIRTKQNFSWGFEDQNDPDGSIYQTFNAQKRPVDHANVYFFDRVFQPLSNNSIIYDSVSRNVVQKAMEGYNGCVFAYGQTSAGKTHTMRGSKSEEGMIPLAIRDIFWYIEKHSDREFLLRVSYIEIYNEILNDLMSSGNKLRIREDRQKNVFVEGLNEEIVTSPDRVYALLNAGDVNRHMGRT